MYATPPINLLSVDLLQESFNMGFGNQLATNVQPFSQRRPWWNVLAKLRHASLPADAKDIQQLPDSIIFDKVAEKMVSPVDLYESCLSFTVLSSIREDCQAVNHILAFFQQACAELH